MTRRYRSFRSDVAKRPPSRGTRAEVRRNHRHHVHDHPLRLVANAAGVAGITECIDDLEALEHLLLAMLRRLVRHRATKVFGHLVDVDALEQLTHGGGANVRLEAGVAFVARLRLEFEILVFVEQLIRAHVLIARIDDDVVGIVDHLLEITQREVEQVSHRRREGLEEPDMGDGNGEFDVSHALAAHFGQGDFDAAPVADDAAIPNALVLAAMAFPVLDGSENAFAEQAILFGLERAVVDGFGLGDFTPRPPVPKSLHFQALTLLGVLGTTDLLRRRDADLDVIERGGAGFTRTAEIDHVLTLAFGSEAGAVAVPAHFVLRAHLDVDA